MSEEGKRMDPDMELIRLLARLEERTDNLVKFSADLSASIKEISKDVDGLKWKVAPVLAFGSAAAAVVAKWFIDHIAK